MPVLTHAMIDAGRTPAGAWNRKQLAVLGVTWPPRHGWKQTIVGKEYTNEDLSEFMELGKTGNVKPGLNPIAVDKAIKRITQLERELSLLKADLQGLMTRD